MCTHYTWVKPSIGSGANQFSWKIERAKSGSFTGRTWKGVQYSRTKQNVAHSLKYKAKPLMTDMLSLLLKCSLYVKDLLHSRLESSPLAVSIVTKRLSSCPCTGR